jgi:aminoglycoside phosphotransferase (APT) family kinase protein
VLDWETATIGDPLTDVGYLLGNWLTPDEQQRWFASSLPFEAHSFSSRDELVTRYEAASGREVGDLTWYRALGRFKIAVILEGSYARHLAGMSDDPFHAELGRVVPNLAEQARAITEGAA